MTATAIFPSAKTAESDSHLGLRIAFQPMVMADSEQPFAWQAVATGANGRSFAAIAATLLPEQRPSLEALRITLALERAAALGLGRGDALIAIPLGAAAGRAQPLLTHLFRAALSNGIASERLVVEINADERGDLAHAAALADACTQRGLSVALDGFAAGAIALKLLARFTPRFVKLDPSLVSGIDASVSRRLMADGVMRLARSMGVTVIARGAATNGEFDALERMGVRHFQIEVAALVQPDLPRREPRGTAIASHRRVAHRQRTPAPQRTAQPVQLGVAL